MNSYAQENIEKDLKHNFPEFNYYFCGKYFEKIIGFFNGEEIFIADKNNKTVSFTPLYENEIYKKYIKPNLKTNELFLIETEGIEFDYKLHKSLLMKLFPKIIFGFKNYYISIKKEKIDEDFKCRC